MSLDSTSNPKKERPSTYVVQDRSNEEELARIQIQDQLITTAMGGPLPEQSDPSQLRRILDVGCGTGNWLLQAAQTYPTLEKLIGIDVSSHFIAYGRKQIEMDASLANRIEFVTMDALRRLEFPDRFFDLVNERFAMSYLRTWDWDKYLIECIRVTRPKGILRFTDGNIPSSTSPAHRQLRTLFIQAFHQAGHFSTDDDRSVINDLPNHFVRHSIQNIQSKEYLLHFQAGTEQCRLFVQDTVHGYRTLLPFIKKWTRAPDNYEAIYQQMLIEMQQPDFEATWTLLTVWGNVLPTS